MVNITAIIPARGGSKRLPGKNIKLLDGRPLIAYSVLTALRIPSINQVVVTSDSREIREAAYRSGVDCVSEDVIPDDTTLSGSLKYAVETMMNYGHPQSDWVILLQPTCPLRQPSLCERWIQQVLEDAQSNGCLTVDTDGYKLGGWNHLNHFLPHYSPMTAKQDVYQYKRENGVFYMFKTENVLKGKPWGDDGCQMIPVTCPPEQSLANIDTQLDWNITEFLFHQYSYHVLFNQIEKEINLNG